MAIVHLVWVEGNGETACREAVSANSGDLYVPYGSVIPLTCSDCSLELALANGRNMHRRSWNAGYATAHAELRGWTLDNSHGSGCNCQICETVRAVALNFLGNSGGEAGAEISDLLDTE